MSRTQSGGLDAGHGRGMTLVSCGHAGLGWPTDARDSRGLPTRWSLARGLAERLDNGRGDNGGGAGSGVYGMRGGGGRRSQ